MGLGRHPEISHSTATDKAADARRLSRVGIDPLQNRDEELERQRAEKETERLDLEAAKVKVTNFREVAADYISIHRAEWKNPTHTQQWENTLATYAFKVIGNLSAQQVGIEHVLRKLSHRFGQKI